MRYHRADYRGPHVYTSQMFSPAPANGSRLSDMLRRVIDARSTVPIIDDFCPGRRGQNSTTGTRPPAMASHLGPQIGDDGDGADTDPGGAFSGRARESRGHWRE